LPHLQAVTSACSALTTAVAMPPPPAQQMHHPQEPSCNSYGSAPGLPPARAGTRGGHNRRRWAALRVRTPSIGCWPVGPGSQQGEPRRVFVLSQTQRSPGRRPRREFRAILPARIW
jgi:hypothetical protein